MMTFNEFIDIFNMFSATAFWVCVLAGRFK